MNMQSIMKQAQKLQADMMKEKKIIDDTTFDITKSFITMTATGNKKITSVKIDLDNMTIDDKEMIEDLILVSINELMEKIDVETENKLGKFANGMPGLF